MDTRQGGYGTSVQITRCIPRNKRVSVDEAFRAVLPPHAIGREISDISIGALQQGWNDLRRSDQEYHHHKRTKALAARSARRVLVSSDPPTLHSWLARSCHISRFCAGILDVFPLVG